MSKRDDSPPTLRCAIYTRKSTEDGLEQEFNSLDAQRDAADEIPDAIGEIAVVKGLQTPDAEIAIAKRRNSTQQVVANRIDSEPLNHGEGIDRIAQRFADLAAFGGDESVDDDLVWKADVGRLEKGWPIHGVELPLILADHMNLFDIRIPPLSPLPICPIAQARKVVDQCVHPDIDRLAWVARNLGTPPVNAGRAHRKNAS